MAVASDPSLPDSCNLSCEEDELERLAVEELVKEARRAKERAHTMGTYGWQKRKATTNKRFLHNTLVSTLRDYKTHTRYHQKSYGHDSRTTESKWSKSDQDDGANSKLICDVIFDAKNHDSKSRKDAVAEDNKPSEGTILRLADAEGSCSKGKEQEVGHMSMEHARPRNYHDHHYEKKEKHGKQSRSRSPLRREPSNGQRDDHERGHYGHTERRKSSKHKKKSKDTPASDEEGHKTSRRHRKSPHKSQVRLKTI